MIPADPLLPAAEQQPEDSVAPPKPVKEADPDDEPEKTRVIDDPTAGLIFRIRSAGRIKNPIVAELYNREDLSDVIVKCEDRKFYAHKAYLSAWSILLEKELTKDPSVKELDLDIKPGVFEKMLQFMYLQELSVTTEEYLPLLHTAIEYQMEGLINELTLLAPDLINLSTCCSLLESLMERSTDKTSKLINQCQEMICYSFEDVVQREQFQTLKLETVKGILSRDDVAAEEMEVLEAVKKWCAFKPERKDRLIELLDYVRFPVMDPKDLGLLDKDPIYAQVPSLEARMFEALIYNADHSAIEDTKHQRFKPRFQNELEKLWEYKTGEEIIHEYSIPFTGFYRFEAKGAKAMDGQARKGGMGAIIEATFFLRRGDKLEILCGSMSKKKGEDTGGGGGTFVSINGRKNPLIVAGGGGGTRGAKGDRDGTDASLEPEGLPGTGAHFAEGGKNGEGGGSAANRYGSGGGGFFSDGKPDVNSTPGFGFASGGGAGGDFGGWGGGGDAGMSGGGGGGGYSGGGGGQGGGGGGSFVRKDALDIKKAAKHTDHGSLRVYSVKKPRRDSPST